MIMRKGIFAMIVVVLTLVVVAVAAAAPLARGGTARSLLTKVYLPAVQRIWPPYPEAPVLQPIDNADNEANYVVRWNSAARAESYVLEENWQWTQWFVAYTGAAAQAELKNRPPGTYIYRCRSSNAWGDSTWSNQRSVTVPGDAPGSISTPSSSSYSAGGKAVVRVINDCPYALYLDFTGPQPATLQLPKCDVCKIYSLIGPFVCPTTNRPIEETRVQPGPYRVYVHVDDPSVRPYVGNWVLEANRRYSVCFFIVRGWTQGADGAAGRLVAEACE